MKYCSNCGQTVEKKIPEGDNRERHVCLHCDTIHYQNPKIVAGSIPIYNDKILLCKRAIEPRYGYWTLPAGFMENQESTTQAAIRETWEEAEAKIDIEGLYTVMNIPQIDQVHMFFRASLIDGTFGCGSESLETRLFSFDEIPWSDLAFPTVKETLIHFLNDYKKHHFPVHVQDIIRKTKIS